ncbi:MAG: inosine/xanthosine triphosphatase [Lewinellaceae bacterium]|nr:inosine/xanthosine triphosphatase [Phaeodactylibacter sp.]MCB0613192.1 inosine/xanthosine triphosphatase [Phaeodactylibacter sp.]MCB9350601.1 inosine/xanthosine triphosphatase [Lewinellaceae bacterium]
MIVVVASENPAKILAVQQAFEAAFQGTVESQGVAVASGVAEQPLSDEETFRGARNRARNARQAFPHADYWVGIEGGIEDTLKGMDAFGWAYICSARRESQARSATFPLPPTVVRRIKAGGELGPIMDELFNKKESKKKGGAVGLLTNGLITRNALYAQPLIMALIPFIQPELWE